MTRAAELAAQYATVEELFVENLGDLVAVRLTLAGVGGRG